MKIENLTIQNYGSSILIFCKGDNDKKAYEIWLDLFNFGAVGSLGSQPEYVADGIIQAWTTKAKLMAYLFLRNVFRLSDTAPKKGVKGGVAAEARKLAEQMYNSIAKETFRTVNSNGDKECDEATDPYTSGSLYAEKPDTDFRDACLEAAFAPK